MILHIHILEEEDIYMDESKIHLSLLNLDIVEWVLEVLEEVVEWVF